MKENNFDAVGYLIKRLVGRWPNFSSKWEKHSEAIYAEWKCEIGNWTQEDIDGTFFVLKEARWKDKLKHYPPSIDDFVQARSEVKGDLLISQELPRYFEYLKKFEKRLRPIAFGNIENELAYDLWKNMNVIKDTVENKIYTAPLYCNCGHFAIFINYEENPRQPYCFNHCPPKYRDAVLGEKK